MYLKISWKDERLQHKNSFHYMVNDPEIEKFIWKPDIYFANAKEASFQTMTQPNFLFRIFPDGTIYWSLRVILRSACNLNLKYYPMDHQQCNLQILSCN